MSLTAFDLSASQGAAVLGLLERASVPPLPAFYKLLYDYVAGVQGLFATRIRDILSEDGQGAGSAREKLYAEFVEPYEASESFERAVERITSRLRTLELVLGESQRAAAAHSASLRQANEHFGAAEPDIALLRDWVQRLERANAALQRTNERATIQLLAAHRELEETKLEIHRSRDSARRDALTGLCNRAGLDAALEPLLHTPGGGQLACAVIDIDHFKTLNDRYGHPVGDEILRLVSRGLLASARETDVVGRPGGDEFVVAFPHTSLDEACAMAERIRGAIAEIDLRGVLGETILGGITVSLGVAVLRPADTIARLIGRADHALYEAKAQGRNRVVAEVEAAA